MTRSAGGGVHDPLGLAGHGSACLALQLVRSLAAHTAGILSPVPCAIQLDEHRCRVLASARTPQGDAEEVGGGQGRVAVL